MVLTVPALLARVRGAAGRLARRTYARESRNTFRDRSGWARAGLANGAYARESRNVFEIGRDGRGPLWLAEPMPVYHGMYSEIGRDGRGALCRLVLSGLFPSQNLERLGFQCSHNVRGGDLGGAQTNGWQA